MTAPERFVGEQLLARVGAGLEHEGLQHHLSAARWLARKGTPRQDIFAMMRGMFSLEVIDALIAEAATR